MSQYTYELTSPNANSIEPNQNKPTGTKLDQTKFNKTKQHSINRTEQNSILKNLICLKPEPTRTHYMLGQFLRKCSNVALAGLDGTCSVSHRGFRWRLTGFEEWTDGDEAGLAQWPFRRGELLLTSESCAPGKSSKEKFKCSSIVWNISTWPRAVATI